MSKSNHSLEHNVKKLSTDLGHVGQDMRDTALSAVSEAGHMLERRGKELKHQSVELRDAVEHYVQKNPFKSMGITALATLGIAFLLRK